MQSVCTYGTEARALKAENLHSLDGVNDGERMCGVSLKDIESAV